MTETVSMKVFKESVREEKWNNAMRRMSAEQPGTPGLVTFSEVSIPIACHNLQLIQK